MGNKPRLEVRIAQIASRQQRNLTRAQLIGLGMSTTSIDRWVRIGRLYRSHPGVYSVGAPAITPHERAMAAVLACGPRAALSHGSALALWGIWKRWEAPFHVTTTADRRPKGIRVHRVPKLDRRDITRHHGIPTTTLARTLLDMAANLTAKSLTRAFNDGRLNRHVSREALAEVIARYPTHRGAPKLQAMLGLAGKRPTRSSLEDTFPAFCKRYKLPIPEMNAVVCGHEVDALFRDEKVIVELDSWEFHSSRVSYEGDRSRDADTLAAGFVTLRITSERYEQHPDEEATRLHAILARRMAA
jgi:hypothetical protein